MKLGEAIHREQSVTHFTAFKENQHKKYYFFLKKGMAIICIVLFERIF